MVNMGNDAEIPDNRWVGGTEIDCKALKKGKATIEFLNREVRLQKRSMTSEAITALYDSIGHDLRLLVGAISQLCSDVEHDPISIEDINSYLVGLHSYYSTQKEEFSEGWID